MNRDRVPQPNDRATSQTGQLSNAWGFFLPVPEQLIGALPEIGPNAFALATYLLSRCYSDKRRAGDFTSWPSYELIREETGLGFRAISSAIKRLEGAGFLEVEKRPNKNSRYTLKAPEHDRETREPKSRDSRNARTGSRETRGEQRQRFNQEKGLNKVSELNNNNDPEPLLLSTELKPFGFSKKWIKKQVTKHGEARVREVLAALAGQEEVRNPAGWIRTALEQSWEVAPDPLPPRSHGDELIASYREAGWLDAIAVDEHEET